MKGILLKLQSSVSDTTLPKLNSIRIAVTKQGTGLGIGILGLTPNSDTSAPVKISSLNSNITFYSDSAGTVLLGTSYTFIANSLFQTVYIKSTNDDTLIVDNSHNILSFGSTGFDWNPSGSFYSRSLDFINSPLLSTNVTDLKYLDKVTSFNMGLGMYGDLSLLSSLTSNLKWIMPNGINCYGDLNWLGNFPNNEGFSDQGMSSSSYYLDLKNLLVGAHNLGNINIVGTHVTYTGGQSKSWGNLATIEIYCTQSLTSSMVDDLLISMSATGIAKGGKSISIIGVGRTSASNAAITTLQGKGFTVTTNSL